ncbi:MAG: hypothetical protein HYY02_11530 [Chloroflexi bacterium]|nr:hypothetical protein [Chloroflexota bacterium]
MAQGASGDPPSFDLHQESTVDTSHPTSPAYDQLVIFDPKDPTKVMGDLAERWEISPDGKTVTFKLVPGVKFHSGDAFTSADAKFSLERMMNPLRGLRSPRQAQLEPSWSRSWNASRFPWGARSSQPGPGPVGPTGISSRTT